MVSNKNTRQIKEMQKAFNNLKTFRLKSGKLKENGLWDEATKSAIAEFVKECRTSKFMQFLAKDPYNFVIIIDRINQNAGVGNSVLYQLFPGEHTTNSEIDLDCGSQRTTGKENEMYHLCADADAFIAEKPIANLLGSGFTCRRKNNKTKKVSACCGESTAGAFFSITC